MFKNARLYRLLERFPSDREWFEEALSAHRSRPCGPLEVKTIGWGNVLGDETEDPCLSRWIGGCVLMSARIEERVLPTGAVNDAVKARVAAIRAEGGTVNRWQRRTIREEITDEMLPKAFTQSRRVGIYVDAVSGWLVVDASSATLAEDVVSLLRESLTDSVSLPLRNPEPEFSPPEVMAGWIRGEPLQDFLLMDACELRSQGADAEVVRISGMDLEGEEVLEHIKAGKQPTNLALDWEERMRFTLTSDLAIKRIRVADALLDSLDPEIEDPVSLLDAEFLLFAGQMRELLTRLDELFGLHQEQAA